jgi:hypothetical protein
MIPSNRQLMRSNVGCRDKIHDTACRRGNSDTNRNKSPGRTRRLVSKSLTPRAKRAQCQFDLPACESLRSECEGVGFGNMPYARQRPAEGSSLPAGLQIIPTAVLTFLPAHDRESICVACVSIQSRKDTVRNQEHGLDLWLGDRP